MKLYSYFRSSTSFRVRIVLNLKKVPVEFSYVSLIKEQHLSQIYQQKNPNKGVPSLQLQDGSVLTQSMAICQFLQQKYVQPVLLPSDLIKKTKVRSFCQLINSGIHPLQNLKVVKRVQQIGHNKMDWAKQWNVKGLNVVQKLLKQNAGKYCFGDTLTMADAFLYPQFTGAVKRFGINPQQFPIAKKVCQNLGVIKQFIDASPQNQGDYQK